MKNNNPKSAYRLKKGVVVYLKKKNIHLTNSNLTDELAEMLLDENPNKAASFEVLPAKAEPEPEPAPTPAPVKSKPAPVKSKPAPVPVAPMQVTSFSAEAPSPVKAKAKPGKKK